MRLSIIFALIIIGSSNLGHTQELSNDISVNFSQSFSRSNESRFGLEYRRALGENFKIKFGVDYGKSDRSVYPDNVTLFGSDSIIISRDMISFSQNYSFYTGIDYEGIEYLSFGASIFGGSNRTLLGAYDQGSRYNPEKGKWENCIDCVYEYNDDDYSIEQDNGSIKPSQYAQKLKMSNYIRYGIRLRIAAKVPIKKRFELTAGYEPTFVKNVLRKENIFQPFDISPSSTTDLFHQVTHGFIAAIRFKF